MKKSILTCMKLALSLAMIFVMTSGCEDDGATDVGDIAGFSSLDRTDPDSITTALTISPAVASVSAIGDKIAFNVSGGSAPYTWSVGSTTAGNISPTTSAKAHDGVVYTAAAKLANTITVTDHIGRITDAKVNGSAGSMTISPPTKAINDSVANYDFTVANGSGAITWTCSDPALGTIVVQTATTGRFTTSGGADALIGPAPLTPTATITITAVDSLNVSATATITMTEN